ncbi:MAG TPA: bifunctional tetrahydrofolate synthase/dihydrofolate synthase, partial [Casimicrobiaceae bacterium]|nr:bifunctional tetrahydrofolate synthase/dihydrofolate synthase [Casimicrobiaceae bacterium]
DGWLAYLETLHPKAIALGLERVALVHSRMDARLACPVVIVTGTNGKGSTCAMLESIYRCAGHRTGLYTSPHLVRYNERVKVDGEAQGDDALIAAFNTVEDARAEVPLTYFEYGTLAAFSIFAHAKLDVAVLEVGLGGRLDAVNIVDADVAVVTSVDIDHVDYLGPTREDIGREKAGVFRAARPVVCADPDPPASLVAHASALGAPLIELGRDYGYVAQDRQWQYWGPGGKRHGLPFPALRGAYQLANASTALAAIDLLHDRLHVGAGAVRDGLVSVELEGRFQVLPGMPTIVLDVAHNPHAARALAATLSAMGRFPQTIAVLGILADKDVGGVIDALRERIDRWFVATLPGPRGASADAVVAALVDAGVAKEATRTFDDVGSAFAAARAAASEADRIIVFGSFLTVAAALAVAR